MMPPSVSRLFLALCLVLPAPPALGNDGSASDSAEIAALAAGGDGEAAFALALRHELGDGVARDPALAADWFRRAAESGVTGACLYLGMKYENGAGLPQDPALAARWYRCAALDGWPMAQYLLGTLLLRPGRAGDAVEGAAWLGLAREEGYPGAALALDAALAGLDKAGLEAVERERAGLRGDFRGEKENAGAPPGERPRRNEGKYRDYSP